MNSCKNCESVLGKGVAYCSSCGQNAHLHRLNGHFLVHEGIHYMTHADKGVFHLIRDLAVKRGLVAKEYIEGKRRKYFSPFTFFMILGAVFVFASMLGEPKTLTDFSKHPDVVTISDATEKATKIGILERQEKAGLFTRKYANLMALVSLPITALVFWLFFFRRKYNYVEHVFAGMYMYGFTLLFSVVTALIFDLLGIGINYYMPIAFLFQIVYMTVFYRQMFPQYKKRRAILASLCAIFISFLLWGIAAVVYALV